MSNEQEKRDNDNYAKNFTRVCNIVLDSYKHLTYEEKFLYIKMREVYWDAKPRFASLREISRLTGYAISALSRILPRLDKCALVHAEIKQEYNPDGTPKGKPKYYITIPDIWELNRRYFECSPEERFDPSDVLLENDKTKKCSPKEHLRSPKEHLRSPKEHLRSPKEHLTGTETSSQANPQPSKDSKDIYKIESKNEGDRTSENQQETSLTHSSTPSSLSLSSQVIPNVEKLSTSTPEQSLTAEEQRIQGYWKQMGFIVKPSEHWQTLSEHIESFEQFDSLFKYTRQQLEQSAAKDKTVYVGNLVKSLNGWKQKQASSQQKAEGPKPMTALEKIKADEEKYGKTPSTIKPLALFKQKQKEARLAAERKA